MKRKCSELKRLSRAALLGQFPLIICGYVIVSALLSITERIFTTPISNMYETALLTGNLDSVPSFFEWPVLCYAGLAAMIIVGLVSSIFTAGIIKLLLDASRGEEVKIGTVFSQFKYRPDRYIILTILIALIEIIPYAPAIALLVIASLMGFEGSKLVITTLVAIALFVIGFIIAIFLALKFALTTYLLVDNENLSTINALKDSYHLMSGNVLRLIYIGLSFIPMALLVILTFGLGALWVQPYMDCTIVNFYLDVKGELNEKEEEAKRLEEEMGPSFDTYV